MFLAAASDSTAATASDIGNWVLVLFALLTGVSTLLQVVAFFRPKPANHEVYATKEELRELKRCNDEAVRELATRHTAETGHLHKRISSLRDDLTTSGEERAERILAAVAELSRTVKADMSGVHNRVTSAEREISRLDERTAPHRG